MNRIQIEYNIISEIRHGSIYNLAELYLIGNSTFEIAKNDNWQDKHSWSKNGNYLAQIKWDLRENEPRFRIIIFNFKNKIILKSETIDGCCNKIRIHNDMTINFETYTKISNNENNNNYGILKKSINESCRFTVI